jgi:hypothetical protein
MKKTVLAMIGASFLTLSSIASASPVYFTDEAAFAAATSGLNLETFDTRFTASPTVLFTGFSASVGSGNVSWNLPGQIRDTTRVNDIMSFVFDSSINSFGINISDFGTSSANTLTATNDTGSINQVFASTPASPSSMFFGVIDSAQFSTLTITGSNGGDRLDYDNLSFGTVPTPATLALFGLGLAGLGWSRRNKA